MKMKLLLLALLALLPLQAEAQSTAKAEDTQHVSGAFGDFILCIRKDTATQLAGTDGDYSPCITDASGRMWVTGAVTNAGTFAVQAAQSGTWDIGTITNPVTVTDGAGALNVIVDSGSITANAGTNLNTSLLALEAGGNLAASAASLSVLDDWDESDRAKVNPIAGQAGVQGGSGVVTALTQRMVLATDVGLPTGSNTIGALTANQSVNVAQINGVTPLMGAGNTGTGSHRVTIASDNAPVTVRGANSNQIISCTDSVAISTASSGNVQLVALSGSTVIYVCHFDVVVDGTVGVQFVSGTGSACATGETDKTGVYSMQAREGISAGSGQGMLFHGAAGEAVCIELSAAVQVNGLLTYTQF